MQRNLLHKAMKIWLPIVFGLLPLSIYALSEKLTISTDDTRTSRKAGGEKAPAALGGFITDPDANVPENAYVTFSTLYNGRRYYLGVDTVLAKTGKDTVMYYESPNYATMWIAGPMWSPTGNVLPTKDYTRTIQSVWLKEKVSRNKYLALGTGSGTYSTLRLLAEGTMWHTTKDDREPSKYINGFLYYYSDATGIDVYRYLRYDPVYGFSRLYETKPANSQRISVWDRKTGSDLIFDIHPKTFTFGWETNGNNITKRPITSQVIYYENVDRFRSRYDQVDVYAYRSTPITDQERLVTEFKLFGYYEWKSNPLGEGTAENVAAYDGLSRMKVYMPIINKNGSENEADWTYEMGWADSTMVYVKEDGFKRIGDVWYDTIYAIGSAPIDRPNARFLRRPAGGGAPTEGTYVNHNDVLYVKFTCDGKNYVDSMAISRHTFHDAPYTTMSTLTVPTDHTFPYTCNNLLVDGTDISATDTAYTFTVSASYVAGNKVTNAVNAVVSNYVGEEMTLDLTSPDMKCIRDTIWEYDEDGNPVLDDDEKPKYSDIILYDTLLVEALLADGVTNAVYGAAGASEDSWIETVRLTNKNQIRVKVKQSSPSVPSNRIAQLRYTYRYWHSSAQGDQVTSTRTIWLVQEWNGAHNDELYSFNHKNSLAPNGLQAVHEKEVTMYAIPEEDLTLPLHRDLWGYYRWFVYDGTTKDRDVENDGSWIYVTKPKNNLGSEFMPINITTSPTSRGQWDIAIGTPRRFALNTATPSPVIRNENTSKNHIKIACDVSAYKDVEHEGEIGVSLKSVTEPTLSYRQIFDVQPAITQADKMETCRTGGGWMETHTVIAPAGRALTLSPQYPIAANVSTATEPAYTEDELQYIYYFNPDVVGTEDNNMGIKEGIADLTKKEAYARIGKKYKAGATLRKARLLTLADINNLERPTKVFVVNPRRNGGYILGGNASGGKEYKSDILIGRTDTADLRKHIEDDILNSGGTYSNYVITLTKTSNNHITLKSNAYSSNLCAHSSIAGLREGVDWYDITWIGNASEDIELSTYSSNSGDRITHIDPALVKMYMTNTSWLITYKGHMTAYSMERYNAGSFFNPNYKYRYNKPDIHLDDLGDDDAGGGSTINQGWCFYEIIEPEVPEHFETPLWEKSTDGSSWTRVARWNYTTNTSENTSGYNMRPDGSLEIANTVHTTPNETILYRLRTEHFQLTYMPLVLRDPNREGPKEGAPIISEEDIEANYTVLFDLGMDQWSKPGTTSVVAHDQPMPWDFTELSFHYPLSAISSAYRDTITEMPLKGEYALLNKFVVPEGGKNTGNAGDEYEARAGASNGYMMVVNADNKRTTIMRFDYPTLSCSNQQIYLVGDYCNPVDNPFEPQITADLEGSNDGIHWTKIYRFKTGKIPYNKTNPWYQMALPIDRDKIKGYKTFRCSAMMDGATNKNAQLLIDRLRFIERTRSFNVFQSKAACVKDDSVSVLLRVDFAADPDLYMPGKLVAYQLQKWNASLNDGKGGYEPMSYSQVKPGYVKDGFTVAEGPKLKSQAGNDYGYIYVPETTYNPQNSESSPSTIRTALVTQAADSLRKWGNITTDEAYNTRINNFKKETGNVVSFEDVMSEKAIFGGATPHIKSYVKEGDKWVVYIACRLKVSETQNGTFRVGMTVMNGMNDRPTFAEESCATFRVLNIKQTTALLLDGETWPNKPRATLESEGKLLAPNENYRASIKLTVPPTVEDKATKNPRCKFDLLHASADLRANNAAGNTAFEAKYGCSRDKLFDAMNVFRSDNESNPMRDITNWSSVRPSDFSFAGRTPAEDNENYNLLNNLITKGILEIGLDYRDIYMGDRADSWFYLIPVPATGLFDVTNGNAAGTADTTLRASVCNDTLWLELHSVAPEYKLRYGFDSRVGDTYIVPTIRASKTDANSTLNVRIAFITDEANKATVIGHDSTRLVETNDPEWTAADPAKKVYYRQDKNVLSPAANLNDYYNEGDIVHFTKQGSFSLKAGYWYRFESAFFGTTTPTDAYNVNEAVYANVKGHSSFILAVAPDTVRWTPAHPDAANYWNDDANWTPVMHNTPAGGFKATVPMGDTKVIIPAVEEGMAPIASDIVAEQKDMLHYGYAKNTCSAILFYPNAQILGQEKIAYDKAYVDVPLTTGTWQTFSPALDDIYSGDMYIPFSTSYDKGNPASGASTDNVDFAPKPFPFGEGYSGTYNPRVYPFAFYQGFYNSSVPVQYYNTDEEGAPVATTTVQSKSSVDWVKTNALNMHYAPGKACVLTGYDATDDDGNPLVVRLPKPHTSYYGFGKNGGTNYIAGSAIAISRSANPQRNLAYDQYAGGFSTEDGLTYTLTNASESEIFFFGNPTMSLVDVYRLCVANADVLKHEEGTYHFTAYNLIDGDNYTVKTITGPGQFFIAPMRAVGLIANATQTTAQTLPIKLTPSALVAIAGDGKIINSGDIMTPMPRRALNSETIGTKRLYIAAANETDWGVKKAYLTLGEQEDAQRGYRFGEDALSIASGLNYYSDESFSTPLSMYTISDNKALMQDIRDTLTSVPLVFTTLDDHYSFDTHTILSFSMDGDWGEVYLYDALNGDSIRIVDGMQIAVETPVSNQLRYFINGKRENKQEDTDHPGVSTGIENVNGQMPNDQMVNDQMVNVFDVLGHKVAVLGKYDILTHIKLPTGVYIIQRGDKTERVVIR